MKPNSLFVLFSLVGFLLGCGEETLPKPKAMLRLDYPKPKMKGVDAKHFGFMGNAMAQVKEESEAGLTLDYPHMKGTIFLTYKPVRNNLEKLLTDAQKLSYEHVAKADDIVAQPYINEDDKVYGMFFEVIGNAASQAQFYATDSTQHFVTGSLYFYARPNYDSIYPAAVYLQKDIRKIMESLRWK
ncbi:MAG: gliding motility lipoprotein GldD [Flavobacteriaceae bacterium]